LQNNVKKRGCRCLNSGFKSGDAAIVVYRGTNTTHPVIVRLIYRSGPLSP
jgi:hypothetical protein